MHMEDKMIGQTATPTDAEVTAEPVACDGTRLAEVAARILEKYREAFEELAK
jgi:hypothetical protein